MRPKYQGKTPGFFHAVNTIHDTAFIPTHPNRQKLGFSDRVPAHKPVLGQDGLYRHPAYA